MFRRFFGSGRNAGPPATETLYSDIVAAARQHGFYSAWDVPDTPLGRFEMLSLHIFLFLHRIRREEIARHIGQEITDEFFLDVDHSLRELGIGDIAIPKRVKKLARMFYGRAASYGEALDGGDRETLAAALARNVMPGSPSWPHSGALARYVFAARELLAAQPISDILSGTVRFPSPAAAVFADTPA
jgi:cytochrome b pre-mRNA-processing protein 3